MTRPEATLIIDLAGADLTQQDARWLRDHPVGGVCLFARNITTPQRTARLTADIRDALGRDVLIATDQEGGAVLRRLDVPPPPPRRRWANWAKRPPRSTPGRSPRAACWSWASTGISRPAWT